MWSHVHNVVCGRHNVVVVLHHHHGVSLVSKPLQDANQLGGVLGVEPNARFIQDVGAAHQGATHARAQGNALGFAAAQGGAASHQGQVAQTEVHQALQPCLDFPEQAFGNLGVGGGQGPAPKGGEGLLNG